MLSTSWLSKQLPGNSQAARLEQRLGRKELGFPRNHSRALVAVFIEVQPSPDFHRTLAPLINAATLVVGVQA